MKLYDLGRLRLLYELSHRGTLTAVAQAMSYSPSAISQQLSVLESEVGVPLLEPDGRRVRLTEEAHVLVAHTRVVLEELEQATADIAASRDVVAGNLRVAALQSSILAWVLDAMSQAKLAYPALRVHVADAEPDHALSALHARQYDVILMESYPGHPHRRFEDTEQRVVCVEPMRLATPWGYGAATLEDLKDSPWILEPKGSPAREWVVETCRNAGFEPDIIFESPDLAVQMRFVEAGLGAAFLPDLVWVDSIPKIRLSLVDAQREIVFVMRRGSAGSPAVRAFFRLLQECESNARARINRHLGASQGG